MKKFAVPIAIGLSLVMSSALVMAKSTIGGIVFLNTYTDDATDNLTLANAGNSRLRIKWSNEDNVSMYYEFAIKGGGNSVRHAYGKWDFSETGQILAGATSTPFAPLNPSVAMVNNSGDGYGNVNPGRPSQIRYTYKFLNRNGALAFALVDPNAGGELAGETGIRESPLPRLDIGMAYKTFNWQIFPCLYIHKQEFAGGYDSLTSGAFALGFKTARGPITLSGEIGSGQNWGNTKMSLSGSTNSTAGAQSFALYTGTSKTDDVDNMGYWLDAGYRFTAGETKGTVHLIYGSMSSEAGTSIDSESRMLGISVPIDLPYIARGFRIRPEFFTFTDKDNVANTDNDRTIAGVQLQFTF